MERSVITTDRGSHIVTTRPVVIAEKAQEGWLGSHGLQLMSWGGRDTVGAGEISLRRV